MNKEYVIKILNDLYTNKLKYKDVIHVIKQFCLEHGKKEEDINEFIYFIYEFNITENIFKIALNYYKRKHEIIILISNNRVIKVF